MLDLEEQLARVWNPDIRPLVTEAYRCYVTSAPRACIALTWVAVSVDIIEKANRLAEDGDGIARTLAKKVQKVRESNLDTENLKVIQGVERTILEVARDLEFIDSVDYRDLERLREDRHLCVHPSLRPLGEFYEPRMETARSHLAAALSLLLVHPPSQGRRAIERFQQHVTDQAFSGNADYLSHTFFDNVRKATRRQIVSLAIKHAALELKIPSSADSVKIANRMGICVEIFAECDRSLVRDEIRKIRDRLADCAGDVQRRAMARLGTLDIFWDALEEPFRSQLGGLIAALTAPDRFKAISTDDAKLLSLVGSPVAREKAPALEIMFMRYEASDKAAVIRHRPCSYFAQYVPELLRDAGSWRGAESITQRAVVPCGKFLDVPQLESALTAWTENLQCRTAGDMPALAQELFVVTSHLRPKDEQVWRGFMKNVQQLAGEDGFYKYEDLEKKINDYYGVEV